LKTAKKLQIPFQKREVAEALVSIHICGFEEVRDKLIIDLHYTGIHEELS
jgi:hypothetical protein